MQKKVHEHVTVLLILWYIRCDRNATHVWQLGNTCARIMQALRFRTWIFIQKKDQKGQNYVKRPEIRRIRLWIWIGTGFAINIGRNKKTRTLLCEKGKMNYELSSYCQRLQNSNRCIWGYFKGCSCSRAWRTCCKRSCFKSRHQTGTGGWSYFW